ncbi:MAG: class I SAM-dependent methyltransferase [Actinomycetota bacterium]
MTDRGMPEEVPWWSPKALVDRELEIRSGTDVADIRNDFASYKALLHGLTEAESGLYMHNEFEPWRVNMVCRDYATLVGRDKTHDPLVIADFGCGAGFTTDGLQRTWPFARVTGFDVSVDAVQYARSRWTRCTFVDGIIVPSQQLAGGPFNLLVCQQFYPFTRTGSIVVHREWLGCLLNNMSKEGLAIITLAASTRDSINDTYTELRREFKLSRVQIAAQRISRRLPFAMSRAVAVLLRDMRPGWVRNLYVLQH